MVMTMIFDGYETLDGITNVCSEEIAVKNLKQELNG